MHDIIKYLLVSLLFIAGMRDARAEARYSAAIFEADGNKVEETIDSLENAGVKVLRHRENLLLVYVPVASGSEKQIRRLRSRGYISREQRGRRAVVTMDEARKCYDAYRIEHGMGLPHAYTGHGVVTGFCDIGFDPMHINFLDSQGKSRVKRLVHYEENAGRRTVFDSDEEYKAWVTDNDWQPHATHVCGIMAGSYRPGNYYGMAPGSDIVATVSLGTDVGLLAGMEDIIEYAGEVGKPAVINVSMAMLTGPRDGTSLFCRYLDMLGEEAVICISSGNFGSCEVTMRAQFSETLSSAKVGVTGNDWVFFDMEGMLDAWSQDDKPFRARIICRDKALDREVFALDWVDTSGNFHKEFKASEIPAMAEIYTGSIVMEGGTWSHNGRKYVNVYLDTHSTACFAPDKKWSRYQWVMEVAAEPGTTVDVHPDYNGILLQRLSGQPPVTSLDNISDMVTGHNLICVGMYVSREEAPILAGGTYNFNEGFKTGEVDYNSSYGVLADGRIMPHTVAPGNMIVSSVGSAYARNVIESTGDEYVYEFSYEVRENGQNYYWAINAGTSMSCPYVAGCIATWLEASPRLGIRDIQNIIAKTNDTSKSYIADGRNGQGWFRPYEGLAEAVEMSTCVQGNLDEDAADSRMEFNGEILRIWNPANENIRLYIVSVDGRCVLETDCGNLAVSEHALNLPRGIYAASIVDRSGRTQTLKINIR